MEVKTKYLLHWGITIVILALTAFSGTRQERPETGFWALKGNLVTHVFEDKIDSLSGPELFELQDEQGLPVWFGRHIFKDVCMTGECKMIRLWLFWDGTGKFLGMQMPENEPLTKSDHTKFEAADYKKLEDILKDTMSILKDLKPEELIIVPDTLNPYRSHEPDGYTAATRPAIADVVVKDAVYTCHTLWHTVYGPVQKAIQEFHTDRINEKYLALWFNSTHSGYNIWATDILKMYPEYHELFSPQIISFIESENPELADQALDYFNNFHLQNKAIQFQMAEKIPVVSVTQKYKILWKFIELKEVDEEVVLKLLVFFNQEDLDVGALNLIYRIITAEHLKNKEVSQMVSTLSAHENNYIRNLTLKLINNTSGFNQTH